MFLVDGKYLWKHNGNNSNVWEKVKFEDNEGKAQNPIDVIEHKDRLIIINEKSLFISKNLDPEVFDDATDSIEIVVGSGKAKNLALGKIEDNLFILTTEGIYRLAGDTISAVAETFTVELAEEKRIISTRTACKVEKSIMYLGDDYELCFTAPTAKHDAVLAAAESAGVTVTRIGRITTEPGLTLIGADGQPLTFEHTGYDHFAA
jgi:hypothetical protein